MHIKRPLPITVTRFCYKSLVNMGPYHYKLECVKQSRAPHHLVMEYPLANIHSACLRTSAKHAIAIFNQLYLPQCNSMALQFQLDDVVYSPNENGHLHPVSGSALTCVFDDDAFRDWKSITTSELAISAMSMIHCMKEHSDGYFSHVGLSLVPSCTVSIPIWISDATLYDWLHRWRTEFIPRTLERSMVTMEFQTGDVRIYSVANDKGDKWISSTDPQKEKRACEHY